MSSRKVSFFLQNEILSIDHGPNIMINLASITLTSHFIMYSLLVSCWTLFCLQKCRRLNKDQETSFYDLSFETWPLKLTKTPHHKMVHCGHKGMDMSSNSTQVGTERPKLWLENTPCHYSTNLDQPFTILYCPILVKPCKLHSQFPVLS